MWKVFIIGIVAVAFLGALAFFSFSEGVGDVHRSPAMSVATSTISEATPAYSIHVDYPKFGEPAIDAQIQKRIEEAVGEIKALPQNPHDSATPQNTLDGFYDSVYIGPDIISVRLILSQYTGGAHPMTIYSGVNFNRTTGEVLSLDDVLLLLGKSVADISRESSLQFKEKFGEGFFAQGADTNPENFSSFVINEDTVTFIFQQYQVAAYVYGPQEMSFKRLKKVS